MGFPVGCTEISLPKLAISTLLILGCIKKILLTLFRRLCLSGVLERDIAWSYRPEFAPESQSLSAMLFRETIPVVKFSDMAASAAGGGDPLEICVVCLCEFKGDEEIRQLINCQHVFHRSCLDRWMDHNQWSCPLCRTPFIPDDVQQAFNERLWAASGIPDFHGDYSAISDVL
ncbi:hypothetical protein Nepgr_024533 [Nepenthes gracilis]|uniref:RING-type domain-containing protein n=1 Tax=Nepenthes gracilis TaxID=150966 RepID=A0AAD3T4D9_NEPGR|nr:hypothetical protein Nepgr_024533 [Nepenthes gracilis]